MATTKTFKVNKGLKYLTKARGVGYYDYVQVFGGTEENISIELPTMTPYDGLSMVQTSGIECADIVDFSDTVLPWKWDYEKYLRTSKFALMPVGETYKVVDTHVIHAPFYLDAASRNITFYKDKSFEIKAKIITPNTDSACQQFITLSDPTGTFDAESGVIFFRKNPNNQFEAGLYTRANSYWNIGRGGSYIANKEQYLRIYYDPSLQSLYFYVSDDGSSWNQVYAVSMIMNFLGYGSEATEVTPVIYFGSWGDGVSEAMQTGAIDFSGCFVYVDGKEVWNGTKNVFTTMDGCLYNYTDTGQATTLNCFTVNGDESVILTPDTSYNNERFLGTVNIAEHTVYDYVDGEWIEK